MVGIDKDRRDWRDRRDRRDQGSPCIMCVQYIWGCSVHWGVFSTSWGYHEYIGGISWVHRGMFSKLGDIMMNVGDTMSTSGMFSTSEGYHEYIGGYHEYIGWCSVHRRDIMIHVGEQLDKILSISIENSDVLNIPRCTHDIPLMYSWYPPDVLNISWCTHDIPWCTHGILPMYWTSPDVLMVMVSLWCTEHPPDVLMISPWCIHGIPPMYSWYPPMYWTPPNVLNIPRCTEHTLYRVRMGSIKLMRSRLRSIRIEADLVSRIDLLRSPNQLEVDRPIPFNLYRPLISSILYLFDFLRAVYSGYKFGRTTGNSNWRVAFGIKNLPVSKFLTYQSSHQFHLPASSAGATWLSILSILILCIAPARFLNRDKKFGGRVKQAQ